MGKYITSEFHRVQGVYEPVESMVEYTYCDQCGSFNIQADYPTRSIDTPLTFVILASYVAAILIGLLTKNLFICLGIGAIGVIALVLLLRGKHPKCRACGNEKISSRNALNYPNDTMKIDVPEDAIVKKIIKTIIY